MPNLHRTVLAGADKHAGVCTPSQAINGSDVSTEGRNKLPCLPVPYTDAVVEGGARSPPAIGAKRNVGDLSLVPSQPGHRFELPAAISSCSRGFT